MLRRRPILRKRQKDRWIVSGEGRSLTGHVLDSLVTGVGLVTAGESPRYFAWSTATGSTTATAPSATLVASHEPPMPTSTTATSTGASANFA